MITWYPTIPHFIYQLMNIDVSTSQLLWITLLKTYTYKLYMFPFHVVTYLDVELLGLMVIAYPSKKLLDCFPEQLVHILTSHLWGFQFLHTLTNAYYLSSLLYHPRRHEVLFHQSFDLSLTNDIEYLSVHMFIGGIFIFSLNKFQPFYFQ